MCGASSEQRTRCTTDRAGKTSHAERANPYDRTWSAPEPPFRPLSLPWSAAAPSVCVRAAERASSGRRKFNADGTESARETSGRECTEAAASVDLSYVAVCRGMTERPADPSYLPASQPLRALHCAPFARR